ncbi:MAG: DNA repair protein RecO [Chitinophagales bacterium]|nr:DNA repair protein RecO [Chitinophagales bacterium]
MLIKTEGIVLKTTKYSESSVIVSIFTRETGLKSYIVSGIRSAKYKSKGNIFQPLQILELDYYYHPSKSIYRIKEYRPAHIYSHLYSDIISQSIAVFSLEAVSKCIVEHEVNLALYDYFRQFLIDIESQKINLKTAPQYLLLQLCKLLGFQPYSDSTYEEKPYFNFEAGTFENQISFQQITLDRKETLLFYRFLNHEIPTFNKEERLKVIEILLIYLKIHIPHFKNFTSLEILKQILNG